MSFLCILFFAQDDLCSGVRYPATASIVDRLGSPPHCLTSCGLISYGMASCGTASYRTKSFENAALGKTFSGKIFYEATFYGITRQEVSKPQRPLNGVSLFFSSSNVAVLLQ